MSRGKGDCPPPSAPAAIPNVPPPPYQVTAPQPAAAAPDLPLANDEPPGDVKPFDLTLVSEARFSGVPDVMQKAAIGDIAGVKEIVAKRQHEKSCKAEFSDGRRKFKGMKPIHVAAACNNVELLTFLQKSGVDIESTCIYKVYNVDNVECPGYSALHLAVLFDCKDAVAALIDMGLKVNSQCYHLLTMQGRGLDPINPLMLAAIHGKTDALEALLGVPGVDLNHSHMVGRSALSLAIDNKNPAAVRMLKDAGATVHVFDKRNMNRQINDALRGGLSTSDKIQEFKDWLRAGAKCPDLKQETDVTVRQVKKILSEVNAEKEQRRPVVAPAAPADSWVGIVMQAYDNGTCVIL